MKQPVGKARVAVRAVVDQRQYVMARIATGTMLAALVASIARAFWGA